MARKVVFFLIALLCAGQVSAQSFEFSGDVSVGLNTVDDQYGISRVDAMLSFTVLHLDNRPLSVEFGGFAYFKRKDRPHETYGALAFDNRWRFGFVKPAYDLVLPSVFAYAAPAVAEIRADYVRARATVEPMRVYSVPWGMSYTDQFGDMQFAVSGHRASDGDFGALSTSLGWDTSPVSYGIAVEWVWDPRGSFAGYNAKAGARWKSKLWEIGLAYLHPDANSRPDALAFDVTYAVTRKVALSAFGEMTRTRHDEAYGLSARYRVNPVSDITLSGTTSRDGELAHLTYNRRY